jgi:phenylacetate-coenzyme A ligase PaaK-like adenylate-forming protein
VSGRLSRLATVAGALRESRAMLARDRWQAERLATHQRKELLGLLRHAADRSPFHARRLSGVRLDESLELQQLPVLDKSTLLARFDEAVTDRRLGRAGLEQHLHSLRDDDLYLGEYRILSSGGTSGQRGLCAFSRDDWRRALGGMVRWNAGYMGLTPRLPRRRIAVVAATTPLHMTARMGASIDAGVHAILRLDARTAPDEQVARLNAFRPQSLIAYPSSAAVLADEQLAGRLRIAPHIVCTTSEVRTEDMEARITAAWGSQPYNCYASTETGILAVDCSEHRGMHLLTDQTLVEIVDEHDRPVADGIQGHHALVTSLVNRTLPILRYRLDDLLTVSPEPCPCGRPFPLLVALDGRSDDLLSLPGMDRDKVVVHPLTLRSPLAGIAGLQQYHVVAQGGGLRVEVVTTGDEVAGEVERRLRTALASQRVAPIELLVRRVDCIARHAVSGKTKLIEAR